MPTSEIISSANRQSKVTFHENDDRVDSQCPHCSRFEVKVALLEDTLGKVQGTLARRVGRMKYLEESLRHFDHRYRHQERLMRALREDRERLRRKIEDAFDQLSRVEKEKAELKAELDRKPENPPPAPPPPPPPPPPNKILAKIMPWKRIPYQRSRSMSRIDELKSRQQQQRIMRLNEDILDAIRNRRYSLRTPEPRQQRRINASSANEDDVIIAKVLERRIRMELQDEDEDTCSNNENTF